MNEQRLVALARKKSVPIFHYLNFLNRRTSHISDVGCYYHNKNK